MVLTKFLRKMISLLKILEKTYVLPYNECIETE